MKKIITFALAAVLIVFLAACGENTNTPGGENTPAPANNTPGVENTPAPAPAPPESSTPAPTPNETPAEPPNSGETGQAMASLIRWMMDGIYSYDYTMVSEGPEGRNESSGSMAVSGENMAMRQEMMMDGLLVKSRLIQKDGILYMVDDENKFIMELPAEMDMTEGMMTDYAEIVPLGSGTGEINGRTLPYEEYAGDEFGATVKYFLDGGEVYGIVSEFEDNKTTMIITNASGSVPAGAFDLPGSYTRF